MMPATWRAGLVLVGLAIVGGGVFAASSAHADEKYGTEFTYLGGQQWSVTPQGDQFALHNIGAQQSWLCNRNNVGPGVAPCVAGESYLTYSHAGDTVSGFDSCIYIQGDSPAFDTVPGDPSKRVCAMEPTTPTETPTPVVTDTPTPVVTETPTPTDAPTPVVTETPAPTETPVVTDTPVPSDTPTPVITDTPVPTETPSPVVTETPVPTVTPSVTPTPAAPATCPPGTVPGVEAGVCSGDSPCPAVDVVPPYDCTTATATPSAAPAVTPTATPTVTPAPSAPSAPSAKTVLGTPPTHAASPVELAYTGLRDWVGVACIGGLIIVGGVLLIIFGRRDRARDKRNGGKR